MEGAAAGCAWEQADWAKGKEAAQVNKPRNPAREGRNWRIVMGVIYGTSELLDSEIDDK
jgi:hypothetical protein